MNKIQSDVILYLNKNRYTNQRDLSQTLCCSLGKINKELSFLADNGYIDDNANLTSKSKDLIKSSVPKNAIILAAGFGMRMVPINMDIPKALIEIKGEPLIERLIQQLHQAGIYDIDIVVGFKKDLFEYLIDKYNVNLIYNPDYYCKNNLHSLKCAIHKISNTYIVPCDLWLKSNPFSKYELYSWYLVSKNSTDTNAVYINNQSEICFGKNDRNRVSLVGISYIASSNADRLKSKLNSMCNDPSFDESFWEDAIREKNKMTVYARSITDVFEINTYEQLREIDSGSDTLKSSAISTICTALNVSSEKIGDISILKKGMTNRSFLFSCKGKKYIMRIPGEGTDRLISREKEAKAYDAIKPYDISDNVIFMDPDSGYKITEYWENTRTCDAFDTNDVQKAMDLLKKFHKLNLKVDHEFDIYGQIQFYEDLWDGQPSIFKDYSETKENVFKLRDYIDSHVESIALTHIDAVPDNFLFYKSENGEVVKLIDWEYAGMQDPHVDIAMFSIYAGYSRKQIDELIDIYFDNKCTKQNRIKIYCYVASCGLLWSNWCEYKRHLNVEFGEYSLLQYRYAKEFYRLAQKFINGNEENSHA